MADKELASITAATTPLAGTELVYLVQGGNSRKATVAEVRVQGADEVPYDNAGSGLSATDAQAAIDEVVTLVGTPSAADVSFDPSGLSNTDATDLQEAIEDLDGAITAGSGTPTSRQVISGAGLTGGGDLTADRTLAVGAGTGIAVNADDVAVDKASDANVRAAASNKVLTADLIESASAFVALTDGANISLDWDAGINRSLTITGDHELDNPTNGQPGTWRIIIVTQDDTGGHDLTFGDQYKFPGGTEPVLTSAPNSVDVLNILCVTATSFHVFCANDMKG